MNECSKVEILVKISSLHRNYEIFLILFNRLTVNPKITSVQTNQWKSPHIQSSKFPLKSLPDLENRFDCKICLFDRENKKNNPSPYCLLWNSDKWYYFCNRVTGTIISSFKYTIKSRSQTSRTYFVIYSRLFHFFVCIYMKLRVQLTISRCLTAKSVHVWPKRKK